MQAESKLRKPTFTRYQHPTLNKLPSSSNSPKPSTLLHSTNSTQTTLNNATLNLPVEIKAYSPSSIGDPLLAELNLKLPSYSSIKPTRSSTNSKTPKLNAQDSHSFKVSPELNAKKNIETKYYPANQSISNEPSQRPKAQITTAFTSNKSLKAQTRPIPPSRNATQAQTSLNDPSRLSLQTQDRANIHEWKTGSITRYQQKTFTNVIPRLGTIPKPRASVSSNTKPPQIPIKRNTPQSKNTNFSKTAVNTAKPRTTTRALSSNTLKSAPPLKSATKPPNAAASKKEPVIKPWHRAARIKNALEPQPAFTDEVLKLARKTGRLNLSNKSLTDIPEDVYNLYEKGKKSVNLEITEDQEKWWEYEPLTRLVLSDNLICAVEHKITNFYNLQYLDMRNNRLPEIPESFGKLTELRFLSLAGNDLKSFPKCLASLENLTELQLQRNSIEEISGDLSRLSTSLRILDISDNLISGSCEFLSQLSSVQKLNLSNNKISQLCSTNSWASNLKELCISSNQLKSVFVLHSHTEMEFFKQLNFIDARKNQLRCLFDCFEFGGITTLSEHQPLNYNDSFEGNAKRNKIELLNLESLMLGENLLDDNFLLSFKYMSLPKLSSLDLNYNKILTLGADFVSQLRHIVRLNISNNGIRTLPAEIGLMKNLAMLEFVGNPLRSNPPGQTTAQVITHFQNLIAQGDVGQNNSSFSQGFESRKSAKPGDLSTNESQKGDIERSINIAKCFKNGHLDLSDFDTIFNVKGLQIESLINKIREFLDFGQDLKITKLSLDSNKLDKVPLSLLELVAGDLQVLSLSKNQIESLEEFYLPSNDETKLAFLKLKELDLSMNRIKSFSSLLSPKEDFSCLPNLKVKFFAPNLEILNLNSNSVSSLLSFGDASTNFDATKKIFSSSIGLKHAFGTANMHTLAISQNRLAAIEDPFIFVGLSTIDVSNNSISSVPLELGLVSSITSLDLVGNTFRVPRRQTLDQGTGAVMQWLRDRIPSI